MHLQTQLSSQSTRGSFTRPENLHITLAFIGETEESRLKTLSIALEEILEEAQTPPFEISFSKSGCFTHSRKELWWIGPEQNDPGLAFLKAIHIRLINRLSEEGFPVDKRPFNAHITLGREIKHDRPIVLDFNEINGPLTVTIDRISLMKSEHIRGLLTYTEIIGKDLLSDKTIDKNVNKAYN